MANSVQTNQKVQPLSAAVNVFSSVAHLGAERVLASTQPVATFLELDKVEAKKLHNIQTSVITIMLIALLATLLP